MALRRNTLYYFLLISSTFFPCKHFSFAIETINSPTQLIRDLDSVTSLNQIFRLGFFSPNNSTNRYIGIWYVTLPGEVVVVWVANRENPLTDSAGVLRISTDGNLVLLDGKQNIIWTTNVSVPANRSEAALLDSGNLVLRESGRILWQSFDHPTHTFLQEMKISSNIKTGEKHVLTSWKSNSDPSEGRFRMELEPLNIPQAQIVVWNGSRRHWRTGPWSGTTFIGVEDMVSPDYGKGFTMVRDDQRGNVYVFFSYSQDPFSVRYVLNWTGQFSEMYFNKEENGWFQNSKWPGNECDYYGKCGSFAICNELAAQTCKCLKGYVPQSIEEWSMGNWSSGCRRKMVLQCERNNTTPKEGNKGDGFLKYERMKVPDFLNWVGVGDMEDCSKECLINCSCTAYSYVSGIGCMLWHGDLIDMSMFSATGVDLYIRVAYSEHDKNKPTKLAIKIAVPAGLVIVAFCWIISWRWMQKQKGKSGVIDTLLNESEKLLELSYGGKLEESEPHLFKYENLQIATNNFSEANKLGEGGFGSVYKGKLLSGEEIAVKRLSKSSGQGAEEFKNEVTVISRLQHRNLVKLLGFCIEVEEKMLIYELVPNNSLDAFLFDQKKKVLLNWRKRFEIIEGIARGVLYLHRDSRLKVIHRDLKPSNILLDKNLNPKISDFGMARIFGVDEHQSNTRRVVGTYGYMSPEYGLKGIFSEKSDVYSFGVLLLEVVTGRRNIDFYHHEESVSLIRQVWELWNEDRAQEVIDSTISETSSKEEVLRCIHVGLLCVQDIAKDRPTMPSVLWMLSRDVTRLPAPNQPAFIGLHVTSCSGSCDGNCKKCSINKLSITELGGR
ncbi:non-specific serine/threonine protein kinase [Ranunculus cassubicifolius]